MPLLSIIVPVFNTDKYIEECIDSILAQTLTDFELILVDDGSSDNSGKICDEYSKRDRRIIVIHQNNAGVSCARNAGLRIAKGKYIGFVDSDDYISPSMYKELVGVADDKEVDVVACSISHYDEENHFMFTELETEGWYEHDLLMSSIYQMPNPLGGCIWNKIYRHSKVKDTYYPEGVSMAEDRMYLFNAFSHCSNGYKIPKALYCVRERASSATHAKSPEVPYNMIIGSYMLLEMSRNYSFDLYSRATDKFLDDCLVHIPSIKRMGKRYKEKYKLREIHAKLLMIRMIIVSWDRHLLNRKKMHAYIYGFIRM